MIEVSIGFGVVGVLCSFGMLAANERMSRIAGERMTVLGRKVAAIELALIRLDMELEEIRLRQTER